jgi:hypothetical protein
MTVINKTKSNNKPKKKNRKNIGKKATFANIRPSVAKRQERAHQPNDIWWKQQQTHFGYLWFQLPGASYARRVSLWWREDRKGGKGSTPVLTQHQRLRTAL